MAVNKVKLSNGETLIDISGDSVTPETLAEGVTAHSANGEKITGTMSANTKTYEITLAKASGWVLLTALDAEVLEHINDESFVAALINMSPYVYEWYTGDMYVATNMPHGYNGKYPAYGLATRINSETSMNMSPIYYPANNTGTRNDLGGNGVFRIGNGKYYVKPGDGFTRAGTYRLTFTW